MDHIFPSYVHFGKEDVSLDTPKGNRPMRKDCFKQKELFPKKRSKFDKDESITEAVKKV